MQIEAETKRTLSIPNHVLPPDAKDAIMRQKYTATMKPVSRVVFEVQIYQTVYGNIILVAIICKDILLQLVSMEYYLFSPLQLLWVLDHLAAVTNQPAETPNERNFQADYGDTIKLAIQRLQNPSNYKTPHIVWEPFKQVLWG